ncbi:FRG domain-containing protein [Brevundimonas sp. BH3]|uniref:FRG domain-containing protein n=1 Tax=Brevundimonas sp. BH3 TaxID=3133089 RepID=UPI00324C0E6E
MADNFNYISFGNRDFIPQAGGRISMSLRRMFEYTSDDTRARLQSLGTTALAYLESLPTFLCSEIIRDSERTAVEVRYGRVSDITVGSNNVEATFNEEINFGEVEFVDADAARDLLRAGAYQLFRTHWAVRDGDVKAMLVDLLDRAPTRPLGAQLVPDTDAATTPPAAPQRVTLGEASSVQQFLNTLFGVEEASDTETFFRGHDVQTYELIPSVLRTDEGGAWRFLPNEDRLCKELLIAHDDEFRNDRFCMDRLVRMAHFELPTRLLDITSNPLVALFFACDGGESGIKEDVPGEVVIFRVAEDSIKYYDSDTVSCIANLANLTHEQKNNLKLDLPVKDFNVDPIVGKLIHFIKGEKPYFDTRIVPSDLGSIVCVKAKLTNNRIKSQSGAFLLYGLDAKMPDAGQDGITINRITITNKASIMAELDRLNINAKTVYPSIDRTAKHLKARYARITQSESNPRPAD